MQEKILILDFGSQYTQLIARRIREINVYCEIHPYNHFPLPDESVKGVVLSGSPSSVRDANAPVPDLSAETNPGIIAELSGLPILGVMPYLPPPVREDPSQLAEVIGREVRMELLGLRQTGADRQTLHTLRRE